ncbi:TonB-dependent receptor domain-containing protein [Neptuniibacter sp. PT8_73]|uniref:TonB-dependent receptor domain-containing protein n=1 Tax=Neptuniibacter sp. PT8_73 TaxID=3398206 RepID=UPI0039F53669
MRNRSKACPAPAFPKRKALSAAIITMMATTAIAEEQSENLDTLRVLGQAEEGYNVALTDDMIEARQASDLEDLLRYDPSITVGGGAPVAQKIYVRGLEDTLLNVTIDGATQAGYLYHHQGRIQVEPELIKDVVIKPGAGNAADGAGALGGAIHFNLKDAEDMLREGETTGAFIKSTVSSNNEGWKNHASVYGMLTDDIGLLASFTHNESHDDYEDGNGDKVDETEQQQKDVRLKLSGDINEDHYFSISYNKFEDEGFRYARPNMGALFHPTYLNIPVDQETGRESWVAKHTFNPSNELINLTTTIYHNDNDIIKRGDQWLSAFVPPDNFIYGDVYNGEWHGGGVESLGLDIRNISTVGNHSFEYGFEYRDDEAYLINSLQPFSKEETEVRALFLQANLELTNKVRLSTGLRYDDYDYTDNYGVNISDDHISPNATFTVDVTDSLELSAGYAQAFKGVSSPEVFFLESGVFGAGNTLSSYTGPDATINDVDQSALKAEESENYELGFKFEQSNFAASGEVFRQTIENAQTIDSRMWHRASYQDDVKVKGYALRMAYFWDDLTLNAGVSHSKPKLGDTYLHSSDMGLGAAYGRTWTLGLEYDVNSDVLLGWDARHVETLNDVPEGQDNKDGYTIHDVYAKWNPNDDLTVGLAINNVFDKFYYDQGTFYTNQPRTPDPVGLPEPGRDFKLYASYKF